MKIFTLVQLLNITTGVFCSGNVDDLYDVLNYMSDDDLFTHALPRVSEEVKPYIIDQHPFLENIKADDIINRAIEDKDDRIADMYSRIDRLIVLHGNSFELYPMHFEDHEVLTPFEELERMGIDESKIITIDLSEDEGISPYGDINWKVNDDETN